ncbi:MAG: DUF128 domain-containing protein [Verrucomicrobia bacterium]|nr:DUF128 domain-containing protein [Verrucomicrobiota bacterium]
MKTERNRTISAIMRILADAGTPLGSMQIARELNLLGIPLQQRMVRNYLRRMDEEGWTENLGRPGRRLTSRGHDELRNAVTIEKVGFVSARVDELSCKMDFDPDRGHGTVILNISRLRAADFPEAAKLIQGVLDAGLGMGRRLVVGQEGHELGGRPIPFGEVAIGTICSVTLNGIFRMAGIPVSSRFGGLMEIRDGRPARFTQIINYDGTTIDPVEIFLKGRMTSVREAAATGRGTLGVSFREIPAVALPAARQLIGKMTRAGLGGVLAVGRTGQPLLDIPVAPGRVGLVVAAGLNAIAAVEEAGIETENHAMAAIHEFAELIPVAGLAESLLTSRKLHKRLTSLVEGGRGPTRDYGLYE